MKRNPRRKVHDLIVEKIAFLQKRLAREKQKSRTANIKVIQNEKEITAVQETCKHIWENGGGFDYLRNICRRCGKEEWV